MTTADDARSRALETKDAHVKKVIIIGGGVAGLGAAYKIRRAAASGHDVDCVLIEKGRLGGKLATDIVPDSEGGEYVVDGGSDAFVSTKPAVARIARMLGIGDEIVPAREENKKTLIVKGKRLIELPDGIMMFAPTKLVPLATTRLYSWPAKFRMALDLVIPRKTRWAEGETAQQHDETLEQFVVRRMGRESLDRLAEPLVGGVHASDPSQMSLAATFPDFLEMEQKFGSVILGFLDQRKKREEMRSMHPPKPGAKPWAFFNTFHRGMQALPDAMAAAVGPERIVSGEVTAVARTDGGWRVTLADDTVIDGDAVIVATEAWAAEPLARGVDERIADLLAQIPCSSSAVVPMAFRAEDCPFDTKWFGILSPVIEDRPLLAVTLSSSKWPDRAPAGRVLLRGFVGGPRNQGVMERSDEEIIEMIRRQFVDLLGIRADAQPVFAKVYRWTGGMPQYTLGHLDRVDELERRAAAIPGFALAGGAYRGVGIPNCIEGGERAVSRLLGEWGIALEEDSAPQPRTR
jgi:oxygen-dependent protoporphyrinogen oxidase